MHVLFLCIYYIYLTFISSLDYFLEQRRSQCWHCSIFFFFQCSGTVSYCDIFFVFSLLFPFPGLEPGTLRGRCTSITRGKKGRGRGDRKKGVHANGVRMRSREPGDRELAAVGG